jgi:uncharacterized repeat protein (TIGR01451 family)
MARLSDTHNGSQRLPSIFPRLIGRGLSSALAETSGHKRLRCTSIPGLSRACGIRSSAQLLALTLCGALLSACGGSGSGDSDPATSTTDQNPPPTVQNPPPAVTEADVAVSNTVDNESPQEGDSVVFTVAVTNNGPADATGVAVTDLLPAGLTYSSDNAAAGTSYSSGSGQWSVGALANGQTATLQLTAMVDAGTDGAQITNTARVSGLDQADAQSANDSATADVNVAVAGTVPPQGLVDYWKLDESSASASNYANKVTGGTSAVCSNSSTCPDPASGRILGARQFNGADDQVIVSDDGSFDWSNSDQFTIEAWIKTTFCSNTGGTVVGRRDVSSALEWSLGCQGTNARFRLVDTRGAGMDLVGTSDITDDKWHHLVAIRDSNSGTNHLYVDGVEEASASVDYAGFFGGKTSLNIGWLDQGEFDQHFAGIIDEVALRNEVLPVSEIRRHHADGVIGLQRGYLGFCAPGDQPVRIMPVGDSITSSLISTDRRSYRPGLDAAMLNAGMVVEMVGNEGDPWCAPTCSHDPDHEGHSGWSAEDIARNPSNRPPGGHIGTFLIDNPPDVVLLHIGTNPVDGAATFPSSQDVSQVEQILEKIDAFDPDITVVLARIINQARESYSTGAGSVSAYNNQLETMAQARIAAGDRIVVVDQEVESGLDYIDPTADFPDGDNKHPTADGFAKMVPIWFDGLKTFMPVCN